MVAGFLAIGCKVTGEGSVLDVQGRPPEKNETGPQPRTCSKK